MTAALAALTWGTCKDFGRSWWTHTRAATHATIARAAEVVGLDPAHLSRWESAKADHPAPLAVLWSRELVPDEKLDDLIAQVRLDRGTAAGRSVLATPAGALRRLMRDANALVGRCITILDDNDVSPAERLEALRALDAHEETLRRTRQALLQADRAGGSR